MHIPVIKAAGRINTLLRNIEVLRAIHGVLPCRYLIVHPIIAGETEQLCATLHTNLHTLGTQRSPNVSHPWVFPKQSHTGCHTAAGRPAVPARTPSMSWRMTGTTQGDRLAHIHGDSMATRVPGRHMQGSLLLPPMPDYQHLPSMKGSLPTKEPGRR